MMRAWRCLALAAMASVVMSCSLLKKPGAVDGGEDAPVSSATAPEAGLNAEAVNASEMARYPDEKPVDHAPLTVAEQSANLRTQAGTSGDLVVVLKKGTEVQKLAEHEGFYLVLADDPKDSSRKLMGWVSENAFESAPSESRPWWRSILTGPNPVRRPGMAGWWDAGRVPRHRASPAD